MELDSKNIHIATRHARSKIAWMNCGESEWVYIGEKEDFNLQKVDKEIASFFHEDRIYLSVDRHTGFEVSKDKAAWNVLKYLSNDVFLAGEDFRNIMEFNKMGIFRRGSIVS